MSGQGSLKQAVWALLFSAFGFILIAFACKNPFCFKLASTPWWGWISKIYIKKGTFVLVGIKLRLVLIRIKLGLVFVGVKLRLAS